MTLYNPQEHHTLAFVYAFDVGVSCLSHAALTLWLLGYPDRALKRSQEALALAQELSHPHSLVWALYLAALFRHLRREKQVVQEQVETIVALSIEHGFASWLIDGTILQGWVLAEQGQVKEGITQIRQGLASHQAIGTEVSRSRYLALLAEVKGKVGQAEDGLATLAEALDFVDRMGERYYEAELYRLKGELLLQTNNQSLESRFEEAEECFQQALAVTCRQEAKSFELRTATSLARLWQQQGKKKEAHELLSPIYDWFTEGFDTADLKDAEALLAELSEGM